MDFMGRHQYEIAILFVSFLALIVGILAIGFLKAFIIIAILDGILFSPYLFQGINKSMEVTMEKKKTKARQARTNHSKTTKDYT